jgi:hypothetical protein
VIIRCHDCGSDFCEPVEFGPDLPELIVDGDGRVWGHRRPGGGMWWFGSTKAVTWSQLVRMRAGGPRHDFEESGLMSWFPWGPWAGFNYGDPTPMLLDTEAAS